MKKIFLRIVLSIALVTVAYGLINVMSTTDPATAAVIKTEIPMLTASNIGLSLNGGLTIIAPDVPGHWESKYGYLPFYSNSETMFSTVETIGIQEFTFVPDNPSIPTTSVHSAIFVWRAHFIEIILLVLFLIALLKLPAVVFDNDTKNKDIV